MSFTRRLQRTGGKKGSFVVTLPKKWVGDMNLEEKAELDIVIENDKRLTIYPGKIDVTKLADRGPCTIIVPPNIERMNKVDKENEAEFETYEMFERKIICSYLIGYTKILLKGQIGRNVRKHLLEFARSRLFGLELSAVGQNETIFTMYVHTVSLDEEFAVIKDATNNVFKDLCELLSSPATKEHLSDFVYHANEITQAHYFYIVRLLKAAADNPSVRRELGLQSGRDLLGARLVIFNVERIVNHAKKIVDMLKELQPRIPKNKSFEEYCGNSVVNALKIGLNIAGQSFSKITEDYPLFKKSDFDSVNQAVSAARMQRAKMIRIRDSSPDEMSKVKDIPPDEMSKVKDISNLRIIVESVGRICEYTSDIGEIALNLLIKSYLTKQTEDQDDSKKMIPRTVSSKQRGNRCADKAN